MVVVCICLECQCTNYYKCLDFLLNLGNGITSLEYIRHGVIALLKVYGISCMPPGPKRLASGLSTSTVRYNDQQHWIKKGDQPNFRCSECSRTLFLCKICVIPLHPEYMEKYYTLTVLYTERSSILFGIIWGKNRLVVAD